MFLHSNQSRRTNLKTWVNVSRTIKFPFSQSAELCHNFYLLPPKQSLHTLPLHVPIVVNAVSARVLLQFAFSQSALCPVFPPHLVMSCTPHNLPSIMLPVQYQGAYNMLGSLCQGSCCTMLHTPEHPHKCMPGTHVWHEPKTCLIAKVKRKWGKGQTEGKRIAQVLALTTLGIYNKH
jgi:hypothetical protein